MKIFIYSTSPFLLQTPSLLIESLLINHIFSWKSKLKHTCFFPRSKIFTSKTHVFLEVLYGTSQTSKLELFRKNINGL